jgi:DNA-binding response OmpR family regulator
MVVADDADVMTPSERGLRVSGFDVSSAKNGAEAVRARVNGVEIQFTRLLHTVPGAGFVLRARE